MKYLLSFLLLLSFISCGVESDSSTGLQIVDVNETIPPDSNETVPPDTNETLPPDSNTTLPPDSNTTEPIDPIFDTVDGEYDENACKGSYMTNSSPLVDDSNSLREEVDLINGLAIRSLYPENGSDSSVVLYYNNLASGIVLEEDQTTVYGDNAQFSTTFDLVWAAQLNNYTYVKTPPKESGKNACYRIDMISVDGNSITPLKVYR